MTSKVLQFVLAGAAVLAIPAVAQTGSAATTPGSTAQPAAPAPSAAAPPPASLSGTKVGAINMEEAIFSTNEGQRDMQTLSKKFEPKQTELKNQNDELEALKKQLNDQGPKLNEDALNNLKKQIETKQKSFDRAYQDLQEEAGNQQQEIASRILQKMAPMIVKYASDNGFGMVIDTSKPWPQGPVLIAGGGVDITKAVVDSYNLQSGVPAPTASGAAAKPPAPKPAGTGAAAKPPAPKPTEPPK